MVIFRTIFISSFIFVMTFLSFKAIFTGKSQFTEPSAVFDQADNVVGCLIALFLSYVIGSTYYDEHAK